MNRSLPQSLRSSLFLFAACFLMPAPAFAQESAHLEEAPKAGQQFRVKSRGDLAGQLALPPDPKPDPKRPPQTALKLVGNSATDYDETWLTVDGAGVAKALRLYRSQDYRRTIGDQKQESALRADVRRLVLIPRRDKEFVICPDGPLSSQEIEQAQLDVFCPRLAGLLPGRVVKVGETWKAGADALRELLDMEITTGDATCKLLAIENRDGRRVARFTFSGTLAGTAQDGPCRQKVDGACTFDLQDNYLCDLSLLATSWMLDAANKEVGRIEGRFVLTRRRIDLPELRPDALARLETEPNEQNTALLFDEPAMGLRFIYPRRWTLKQADGRQLILDDGEGAGLLVTLEPLSQLPTAAQFEAEARTAIGKQGGTLLRSDPPRRLLAGAEPLDQFRFEVENAKKQRLTLDYFVLRQAAGGATAAFNSPSNRAADAAPEAERILRSLRLTPPKKP